MLLQQQQATSQASKQRIGYVFITIVKQKMATLQYAIQVVVE